MAGIMPAGSVLASRYEILSLLGRGGMGLVYKARDCVLEETVAVKVLLSEVSEAPDPEHRFRAERRFRSEIKLARKVRHKNVCAIHEYGEEGPVRFITMEFVEGTDLKQLLHANGAFPAAEGFDITIQIAEALQAIHDVGVVHRDLKTSNVMLDRRGVVRLMDFGIAKQLGPEAAPGATAVGHVLGTPEYMSPEQARGASIDFRSDIYALGVVIYEVFTGHVPFHGNTPIATIFKQLEEPLRIEGPEARQIPGSLEPVLLKALAKAPDERHRSARELAEDLHAAWLKTVPEPASAGVATRPEDEPLTATIVSPTPAGLAAHTRVAPRPRTPDPSAATLTPRGSPPLPAPPRPAPRPSVSARATPPAEPSRPVTPLPDRPPRPQAASSALPWLAVAALALGAIGFTVGVRAFMRSRGAESALSRQDSPSEPPVATSEGPQAASRPVPASQPAASPPELSAEAPPPSQPALRTAPATLAAEPAPARASPPVSTSPPTTSTVTRPTPSPVAERSPPPSMAPASVPSQTKPAPAEAGTGVLQMRVSPWAEVVVDGERVGTTPLKPLELSPGTHVVRLTHPDFKPLQRKVTLRAGETTMLEVDLTWEAFPKH